MTRHGDPIRDVPLKDTVETGIAYSMLFAEWEAAHAAGLSLWDWEREVYPRSFKARVLAWHNLHGLVEAHKDEAASEAAKRKSKSKSK